MCHSGDHTKPRCPLLLSGEVVDDGTDGDMPREVQVGEEDIPKDHVIISQAADQIAAATTEQVVVPSEVEIQVPTTEEPVKVDPSMMEVPATITTTVMSTPLPSTNVTSSHSAFSTGSAVGLSGGRPSQKRSKKDWNNDMNRLVGTHFPVTEYETKLEYKVTPEGKMPSGKQRNLNRGYCVICSHKSTVFCRTCHVYLCVKAKVGYDNCFYNFHTKENIMECVSGMVAAHGQPQQSQQGGGSFGTSVNEVLAASEVIVASEIVASEIVADSEAMNTTDDSV